MTARLEESQLPPGCWLGAILSFLPCESLHMVAYFMKASKEESTGESASKTVVTSYAR